MWVRRWEACLHEFLQLGHALLCALSIRCRLGRLLGDELPVDAADAVLNACISLLQASHESSAVTRILALEFSYTRLDGFCLCVHSFVAYSRG